MKKTNLYLFIILLLLSGCSSIDEVEIPEHILALENVTIHESSDPALQVQLTKEQAFGADTDQALGHLGVFATDDNGRVFIVDMDQNMIHVFDQDGHLISSIGGEGRGPGEFSYINSLDIYSNQLIVVDSFLQRASFFSLDTLELDRMINLQPMNQSTIEELNGTRASQFFARSDDSFLIRFVPPRRMEELDQSGDVSVVLMDSEQNLREDVMFKQKDTLFLTTIFDGNPSAATFSFLPHSVLAVSDNNHMFSAWTQDFLINVHDPNGEKVNSFFYPTQRVPLIADEVAQDYPHEMHQQMIREPGNLPDYWPAFDNVVVDDENRLWVSTIVENFDVYEWWVLEESGELITRFEWPREELIEVIRNGYIYTRETDEETGLQQVVRHQFEIAEV